MNSMNYYCQYALYNAMCKFGNNFQLQLYIQGLQLGNIYYAPKRVAKIEMEKQKEQKVMKKSLFEVLILSVFYYDLTAHHDWSPCLSLVLWWRNSMESLLDPFIFMITQLHYDERLVINIDFRIEFKKFIFDIYSLSILKIEHILEL